MLAALELLHVQSMDYECLGCCGTHVQRTTSAVIVCPALDLHRKRCNMHICEILTDVSLMSALPGSQSIPWSLRGSIPVHQNEAIS